MTTPLAVGTLVASKNQLTWRPEGVAKPINLDLHLDAATNTSMRCTNGTLDSFEQDRGITHRLEIRLDTEMTYEGAIAAIAASEGTVDLDPSEMFNAMAAHLSAQWPGDKHENPLLVKLEIDETPGAWTSGDFFDFFDARQVFPHEEHGVAIDELMEHGKLSWQRLQRGSVYVVARVWVNPALDPAAGAELGLRLATAWLSRGRNDVLLCGPGAPNVKNGEPVPELVDGAPAALAAACRRARWSAVDAAGVEMFWRKLGGGTRGPRLEWD